MKIEITEESFRKAAAEGMDAFLKLITDAYLEALGGELTPDGMARLNGWQHTLLGYRFFQEEVMDGGFCQLIQNGYGPYIFDNPFAKAVRMMGVKAGEPAQTLLHDLSKAVNKARKIYVANKAELTRERSDDEFMAMYEQYPKFDDIEDWYIENEEDITKAIAYYVDEHLSQFLND